MNLVFQSREGNVFKRAEAVPNGLVCGGRNVKMKETLHLPVIISKHNSEVLLVVLGNKGTGLTSM